MTTKPPTRVEVGNHIYELRLSRKAALDCQVPDGAITFAERSRIVLSPDVSPSQLRDNVMHELTHALVAHSSLAEHENSLAGTTLSPELEEHVVRILSPAVLALLRRNPDLVAFLAATS